MSEIEEAIEIAEKRGLYFFKDKPLVLMRHDLYENYKWFADNFKSEDDDD